ncbi:MAG: LacI family DNA-binding transcriptional regulator [Pseudonocardia sp.]|nr:LacI family DNA-binding transcriptional regulator [Pseudonocardia sp.]
MTEVPVSRPTRNAPTLESVAARAGVSRATAGRVLAGSSKVGEQAREAVLAAAAELSYVTNRAARSLMTRRSDSIAFVVAEPEDKFFSDPYFASVLRGAHAAVATHDVQLMFAVLADDAERERFERFARGGHLDGVVFVSLHGDDPLPQRLQQAGVPVILSGRPFANDLPPVSYVDADNIGGSRAAVRLLVERGRTCLATITGPLDMTAAQDRHDGFVAELADHGLTVAGVEQADFSVEGGRRAMLALLDATPGVDGVFAANDLMALGAMQAAAERGRRVPEDLSVVGFDDIPLAAAGSPPLTTVRQPMMEMGQALAARLLEFVDTGEAPEPLVVPTEIVLRGTV